MAAISGEPVKPVLVALSDGSMVRGQLHTRQYTLHGRLSDAFNHAESRFLVLTKATFLRHAYPQGALDAPLETVIINKRQIVFALPLEDPEAPEGPGDPKAG